eukprot:gene6484-8278_t
MGLAFMRLEKIKYFIRLMLMPDSLRTIGDYTFQGLLKRGQSLQAHPRYDSIRNRIVHWSVNNQAQTLTFFEFDDQQALVQPPREVKIPTFSFSHDFVITKNHYIFRYNAAEFDALAFVLGIK